MAGCDFRRLHARPASNTASLRARRRDRDGGDRGGTARPSCVLDRGCGGELLPGAVGGPGARLGLHLLVDGSQRIHVPRADHRSLRFGRLPAPADPQLGWRDEHVLAHVHAAVVQPAMFDQRARHRLLGPDHRSVRPRESILHLFVVRTAGVPGHEPLHHGERRRTLYAAGVGRRLLEFVLADDRERNVRSSAAAPSAAAPSAAATTATAAAATAAATAATAAATGAARELPAWGSLLGSAVRQR